MKYSLKYNLLKKKKKRQKFKLGQLHFVFNMQRTAYLFMLYYINCSVKLLLSFIDFVCRQLCVVSEDKNKVDKYSSVGLDGTMVIWDFKVFIPHLQYFAFHWQHWLFIWNVNDISAFRQKHIKYSKIAFSYRNNSNFQSKEGLIIKQNNNKNP